jgi:hypothetical protein
MSHHFPPHEMLSLPIGQDKIDEEEMENLFNSLQIEQNKDFLTGLLPENKDIPNLKFPLDTSLFKGSVKDIISMVCIFLDMKMIVLWMKKY